MHLMNVDLSMSEDVMVVKPDTDIRVKTLVDFRRALEMVEEGEHERVAIDLSLVDFVDSSGVGLLMNYFKKLRQRGGKLCLFNYGRDIRELLELTGVGSAIPLCDSMEDVCARFGG